MIGHLDGYESRVIVAQCNNNQTCLLLNRHVWSTFEIRSRKVYVLGPNLKDRIAKMARELMIDFRLLLH